MDAGYNQEETLRDQQTTNAKAKLSDLTKADLVELIGHLEHEVHSRDAVINEMMNQQTREVLYQSKYGRLGVGDPFTALQRDSEKVTNDNFDHNQVKSLFDNQLLQLENLIETQRRAQATMREQKLSADERYKRVCQELEVAKRQHARDTAQGDDVTVALEKEREKLQQDLVYTRSQLKKCERELRRTKSHLEQECQTAVKHKQVALDLIKERRRMVSKVAESEKKNEAIALLLQKEQQDSRKSENSKLLQLEARMEKQLMDFDIEREQHKTRLRKEEAKVRDLLLQLTDIKDTVLSLQQESSEPVTEGSTVSHSQTDTTYSAVLTTVSTVIPISLVKSISPTVSFNALSPVSSTAGDSSGKTRSTPRPVTQTTRQSNSMTGQLRASQPHSSMLVRHRQPVPVSTAGPKTVSQAMVKSQGDASGGPSKRILNYKQEASSRSSAISSSSPVRLASPATPHITQNSPNNKQARAATDTGLLSGSHTSTSIPARVIAKANNMTATTPAANVLSNRQPTSTSLTSKQSTSPVEISTTSNHMAYRSTPLSSRSVSVPPHLSTSLTIMDPKLASTSTVSVANWRNSPSDGSLPPTDTNTTANITPTATNLISPNDKSSPQSSLSSKAKPPPPVRNVSLPSSKKYHSIENTS